MYDLSRRLDREVLKLAASELLKPWRAAPTNRNRRRAKRQFMVDSQSEMWTVYVIATQAAGPVKIGIAKDATKRRRALQTGHPEPLKLFSGKKVEVGLARVIEQNCHKELRSFRLEGEWFRISADAAAIIVERVASRFQATSKP